MTPGTRFVENLHKSAPGRKKASLMQRGSEKAGSRRTRGLAVGFLVGSLGGGLHGATNIWDGGEADDLWSSATNWVGDVAPGAADMALFNETATGVAGDNVVDQNLTIQQLTFGALGTIATAHTTTISGGVTLLVTGDANGATDSADFNVGHDISLYTGSKTTDVVIAGSGELRIGNPGENTADMVVGRRGGTGTSNGFIRTTLDMSALSVFSANLDQMVVSQPGSDNGANVLATVRLAKTNSIVANTVTVGDSRSSGPSGNNTVRLGQTNTIQADSIYIGRKKTNGVLDFDTGLSGPTVTIRNRAGTGAANLYIGHNDSGNTGTTPTSLVDFRGGTVDAQLNELRIGRHDVGAGSGSGELRMGSGTITASNVFLAHASATGVSANPQNTKGTITMTGGVFTVYGNVSDLGGNSTINVDAGSMSVGGDFRVDNLRVGVDITNATLAVSGGSVVYTNGSDLIVGRRNVNMTNNFVGTLDLSRAGEFVANVDEFLVGTASGAAGAAGGQPGGRVLLATNNVIAAREIVIGDSDSVGLGTAQHSVVLGRSNVISVDTLVIGGDKTRTGGGVDASLAFGAGGGVLHLGSVGDRVTNVFVGRETVGTGGGAGGVLNMTGGVFNAHIDSLVIGSKPNSATGTTRGIVNFSSGTVDVASMILGERTDAGSAGIVQGTFNMFGGTLIAGTIAKGAGNGNNAGDQGDFNWTGGTLSVSNFNFGLVQNNTSAASTLSPGQSVGETSVNGDFDLIGGRWLIELDSVTMTIDLVNVVGELNLAGVNDVLEIDVLGLSSVASGAYVFATYGTSNGVFDAEILDVVLPVGSYIDYAYAGNQIALVVIPEPDALTLCLMGVGLLGWMWRRGGMTRSADSRRT